MDALTTRQAAKLAARFFGLYLLFFGSLNLTEIPVYWLRSVMSHTRNFHDPSYDLSLAMLFVREIAYFLFGTFFFFRPGTLASLLLRRFYDEGT